MPSIDVGISASSIPGDLDLVIPKYLEGTSHGKTLLEDSHLLMSSSMLVGESGSCSSSRYQAEEACVNASLECHPRHFSSVHIYVYVIFILSF